MRVSVSVEYLQVVIVDTWQVGTFGKDVLGLSPSDSINLLLITNGLGAYEARFSSDLCFWTYQE